MPYGNAESSRPSRYSPRLGNVRDIRKELVRVYRASKAGEIDIQLIGRLVHALNSLVAIDRDHGFEQRLDALESALAEQRGQAARTNGGTHWGARP
jgi:hypothetical protein